jgi:uncharacterized protein (TIGR03083 family)
VSGKLQYPGPIYVADRFPALRLRLLELLSSLTSAEWQLPTAAKLWSVKDVAAHLLGGDLGNLSRRRDTHSLPDVSINSYAELVDFINNLNDQWVRAARRLSPRVLCDLLAASGPPMEQYFASLNQDALSSPVDWAGPEPAPVWLDVAREFTERWHHQQQIRDAAGKPALYEPYFMAPVLDAFMRSIPWAYRNAHGTDGTSLRVHIQGDAGGKWLLQRRNAAWELFLDSSAARPTAEIAVPQDTAWRMFTRGLNAYETRSRSSVQGEESLVRPFFGTLAILA